LDRPARKAVARVESGLIDPPLEEVSGDSRDCPGKATTAALIHSCASSAAHDAMPANVGALSKQDIEGLLQYIPI
jgi:hypothetical protein